MTRIDEMPTDLEYGFKRNIWVNQYDEYPKLVYVTPYYDKSNKERCGEPSNHNIKGITVRDDNNNRYCYDTEGMTDLVDIINWVKEKYW